jgi:hypothetical protein
MGLAHHVVISEVGISWQGVSACDYVELYNPTANPVDLSDWSVQRGTSNPGSVTVVGLGNISIQPWSYLLVVDNDWGVLGCGDSVAADVLAPTSLVINNDDFVALVKGPQPMVTCEDKRVVDIVAFDSNLCGEGRPGPHPTSASSVVRKARTYSRPQDMIEGGVHSTLGNGTDSDDNLSDWIRLSGIKEPQNSDVWEQPTN